MKNIMVDLETLGTVPGCSILSIGAVLFDEFGPCDQDSGFYTVISRESCKRHGLHESRETVHWWNGQNEEARKVITDAEADTAPLLVDALTNFNRWIAQHSPGANVWGNGADFDNAILAAAYWSVGIPQGWKAYNGRCYRTVKNQYRDVRMERTGTHHNALDDAKSQATHLALICQRRGFKLS